MKKITNEIEMKMKMLVRIRNSIMHFQNFNLFMMDERISFISGKTKESDFIFHKNKIPDQRWTTFSKNKNLKSDSTIFYDWNIGFYVIQQKGQTQTIIESSIIRDLKWWFPKKEKLKKKSND